MRRLLHLWLVAILAGAPLSAWSQARTFALDDLYRIVRISDPQISPDGRSIAIVIARADLENNRWDSELAVVDIATGNMRQLTRGRRGVGHPRWTPDGTALGFIARVGDGKDAHTQILVMSMSGGDAEPLTKLPTDVQQFAWSPDDKTVAFAAADEPPKKTGVERFNDSFEIDNDDFLTTEAPTPTHLWLISANGGTPRRLTSGSWSLPVSLPPGPPSSPIQWSPDGRALAIARAVTPHEGDNFKTTLARVDIENGTVQTITGASRLESFPSFSPDGQLLAYWYGRDGDVVNQNDLHVVSSRGGAPRNLTLALDRCIYRSMWMPDGKSLLVAANDTTQTALWVQPLEGAARRLNLGPVNVQSSFWAEATVSRTGGIAFVGSEINHPAELYYMESATATPRRLTDLNHEIASVDLGRVEAIDWQSDNMSHNGTLTYPPHFDSTRKYPLVLVIHGGPQAASLLSFSSQAQLFAANGWVVFQPNYRGSDQRGNAYYRAIAGDAGEGPGRDVMAGVAAVKKLGFVDESRVAVTGWSYGGFMTTWLIGHYQGWRAAMAGAPVIDFVDQAELSDGGWDEFMGGGPLTAERIDAYRRQSPITYASKIRTPTLIMSNTGDFRVPISQAYKLFHALKDNGVETKFIGYPMPGHNATDPVRQRDVQKRWMEWLSQHFGS